MAKGFNIRAWLRLDTKEFDKKLDKSKSKVSGFSRSIGKGFSMVKTGALAAVGAITAAAAAMGKFIGLANKQIQAETKVATAVKSTGMAAGFTTKELVKMAGELQNVTTFGDEDILEGVTTPLLTFTNITDEAFKEAQKAVLDMSTALGTDLKSTSIQVGKALNDPIKGVTALSRAGVQFTDTQKEMIKQMVETGDVAGAQKVILAELNKEFGGQSEAAAKSGLGKWEQLKNTLGDIGEQIGMAVLPMFNKMVSAFAKWLPKAISWFNDFINKTIDLYNEFVDLYNSSESFRKTVAATKIAFKVLWEYTKAYFDSLNTMYTFAKDAFIAIFDSDKTVKEAWEKAANSFKETWKKAVDNVKNYYTKEMAGAATGGAKKKSHIIGIGNYTTGAGKGDKKIVRNIEYKYTGDAEDLIEINGEIESEYNDITVALGGIIEASKQAGDLALENAQKFKDFGDVILDMTTWTGTLQSAFSGLSTAIEDAMLGNEDAFRSFAFGALDSINMVIQGLAAQAAAALIAGEAVKGVYGLIAAAIAMPILIGLLKTSTAQAAASVHAEHGAIVPGTSFSGDKVPAMVNSGEMILNKSQQSRLFALANGASPNGGNVQFRIKGTDLVGVLNKYGKKTKNMF